LNNISARPVPTIHLEVRDIPEPDKPNLPLPCAQKNQKRQNSCKAAKGPTKTSDTLEIAMAFRSDRLNFQDMFTLTPYRMVAATTKSAK
jgi:hypothetical protein